jgi:hypothetical protein
MIGARLAALAALATTPGELGARPIEQRITESRPRT